jgi:hypothetical protein
MADKSLFDRYLLALRKTALDEKTEHTDRLALETLLQALADETRGLPSITAKATTLFK